MDRIENNIVELVGILSNDFVLDHETKADSFYKNTIEVKRYSGTVDKINIIAPKSQIDKLSCGDKVEIKGYYRSRDVGEHLVLYVFAKEINLLNDDFFLEKNEVVLRGYICKQSVYRETPMGRTICDMYLAVNRASGKNDYIPCIAWGKIARKCKDLEVGTKISLLGRLQSREYVKNDETRTAYEVSVMEIIE